MAPPELVAKTAPPELDARVTVTGLVVGLPKASCSCTVIGPSVALDEAVPVTADVVKTSLAGGAGLTTKVEGAGKPLLLTFESNASSW